jgi:hypothetical protein
MKLNRREALKEAERPANPRSLIASAVQVQAADVLSWRSWALGRDEAWQRELWRLYDNIGEFRFAANWVGSACSRCRIYVADVDEYGTVGGETKDPDVAALANTMLGGPAQKAELLRLMGINLTVGGEFYIIGQSGRADGEDKWYVTTPAQLKRWAGGVTYYGPDGPMQLMNNMDMIIRVWTPHPARTWLADSPARSAMNILIEIERLTRFVFSQIDSRLFSAGLLTIPADMDFDDNDGDQGAADSLMAKIAEAGTASLKGEGSAAGIFPMVVEVPIDALGKIQLVKLDSPLSDQARGLRSEAILRFAYSMDFPPEIMTGIAAASHWSAWYIDENAVKTHIEPILGRIVDALTQAYLVGAIKKLGKDPKRFTYAFSTAGLSLRPTRLQDAINLYKENLLSWEAVLEAGYFRLDQKMSQAESAEIFLRQVAIQDPTQLSSPSYAAAAGVPVSVEVSAGPPPPPPIVARAQDNPLQPLPERQTTPPGQNPTPPHQGRGIQASATRPETLVLIASANLTVLRALELAGGRMTDRSRNWDSVPKHERHTLLRTSGQDQIDKLLTGAWTHVPAWSEQAGVDATAVTKALETYTSQLLLTSQPHVPDALVERLRQQGFLGD